MYLTLLGCLWKQLPTPPAIHRSNGVGSWHPCDSATHTSLVIPVGPQVHSLFQLANQILNPENLKSDLKEDYVSLSFPNGSVSY